MKRGEKNMVEIEELKKFSMGFGKTDYEDFETIVVEWGGDIDPRNWENDDKYGAGFFMRSALNDDRALESHIEHYRESIEDLYNLAKTYHPKKYEKIMNIGEKLADLSDEEDELMRLLGDLLGV